MWSRAEGPIATTGATLRGKGTLVLVSPNFLLPATLKQHLITQRAQRSKNFELSSEIENFERECNFRASNPPRVYFLWGYRDVEIEIFERDSKFRSILKISSEIEFFWPLGPLGRVHAKGVVLCERTCFCLLSTFYKTLPSKNPSKNLVFTESPYRRFLRTLPRSTCC